MKKVLIIVLAIAGFVACDKVENPNQNPYGGPANTSCNYQPLIGSNFIIKTNDADSNYRKVLIEDYTGHKCGNCPPAAATAEALNIQYKDSLVVLAVHAGGFAATTPTPEYAPDYTSVAGNDWYAAPPGFGFYTAGNPNGMVNRRDFPTGTHVKPYTTWGTIVNQLAPFKKWQAIRLNVTTNYDTAQRKLNVDVRHTYLRNYGDTTVKLSVVLSEDSIIGTQKDYSKVPVDVYPYVFMNVMRGSLNGTWGVPLTTCVHNYNYIRGFAVNAAFNDKHLNLIVFAYNGTTREIIQVEKVKIR